MTDKQMNTSDEQAASDYYTLLGTYIRELNKAHKGIRRLVRRNRKLEDELHFLRGKVSALKGDNNSACVALDTAVRQIKRLEAWNGDRLHVGRYKIAPSAQHGYVIQIVSGDGGGEAMGVKEADLAELIDRYYKENF